MVRTWALSFFFILAAFQAKAEMRVYFTPSLDCENAIIEEIQKAQTIDIAVYAISNHNIVEAIKAARKRGAEIRIISDRLQAAGKSSLIPELRDAGFEVRLNKKHKIEHNKFAVFDDSEVVSGSYNWTASATKRNSENCLFFQQPNSEYSDRFEYLWAFYNPE